MKAFDLSLYLVTDSELMTTTTVPECVEKAIQGGVTMVQLREKNLSSRAFYETACAVLTVTKHYHVPLIINDRVDIALAVGADGVHLGQKDLPATIARKLLGENKIIGVTAPSVELAQKAKQEGADYIGVGAIFGTTTKSDAKRGSIELLRSISNSVEIPMVAIGGINKTNAAQLCGTGVDGIAVVSGIVAQSDIKAAAQALRECFLK
ncbi:MAG: thiamine phosphate synthase [Acutalibacteraceae bacterium]